MDMLTTLHTSAHQLGAIPDGTVQAVITSPPYYGLRSYAGEQDIEWPSVTYRLNEWCEPVTVDAWRGPLGLEPSPVAYIGHLILCLREWGRVLRDDGVCFVNLGDSYAGSGGAGGDYNGGGIREGQPRWKSQFKAGETVKPKDLLGIPWMFAFAARADGWWLRSDIIWAKPNPMPESVTDRPTKAHEYVFLLAKSPRYWWDADAVREAVTESSLERARYSLHSNNSGFAKDARTGSSFEKTRNGATMGEAGFVNPAGRNVRTVWNIATSPYPGAHYAVFPERLVEPMVKAGSKPGDVILDPFAGSGTTGRVAIRFGRRAILCDVSAEYLVDHVPDRTTVQMELLA